MARKMKTAAILFTLLSVILAVVYLFGRSSFIFTLLITFGTTAYHFVMRLLIGTVINSVLHNRVNYRAPWFRVSAGELKLYKLLRVKRWKGKMATYDPKSFDSKLHTWGEIAQATCQAELVHELIILLSFVPVLASRFFGALPIFIISSFLAACFDAMFVIMQRYNRPRMIRLIEKQ